MAEVKLLEPIPVLYDFILYWECANKDWKNWKDKLKIKGDGSLVNALNWNSTYSYDPDDKGGKTLFGVTETTWKEFVEKYPNKGYNKDLNTMGKQEWFDVIKYYWEDYTYGGLCANYACAFTLLQMGWMGFNPPGPKNLLSTLKSNADIKDYPFISKGSIYKKIADATHAYSDPMIAYNHMIKAHSQYLYNISVPSNDNYKFRMGWLNRSVLGHTPYGLFVCVGIDGSSLGLKKTSGLDEWVNKSIQISQNIPNGYVKLLDWGATPETIKKMTSDTFNYTLNESYSYDSFSSNNNSGGAYGGCNSVLQLGNYSNTSNTPEESQTNKQEINRKKILNTLIGGYHNPNSINMCAEFLTVDKKKGVKTKSED
jgi:hypothetical protein